MARTKSDAGKKAGGKASVKVPVLRTTPGPKAAGISKRKSSGGTKNAYHKRPIPKWQKPIEEFLSKAGSSKACAAATSSSQEEPEIIGEIASGSSSQAAITSSYDQTAMSNDEVNHSDKEIDEEDGDEAEQEVGGQKLEGEEMEDQKLEKNEADEEQEVGGQELEGEEMEDQKLEKNEADEEEQEVGGQELEGEEMEDEKLEDNESSLDVSTNGEFLADAANGSSSNGIDEDVSQIPETPNQNLDA